MIGDFVDVTITDEHRRAARLALRNAGGDAEKAIAHALALQGYSDARWGLLRKAAGRALSLLVGAATEPDPGRARSLVLDAIMLLDPKAKVGGRHG